MNPASRKPSTEEINAAKNKTIPDVLAARLEVLFVGINPSLYSAAVGHHFARPGNRFWPALAKSGLTPRLFTPFEEQRLVEHGIGLTNFVARATARADELSNTEIRAGVRKLQGKVRRRKVRCVAFLGITAYRTGFKRPQAQVGAQAETLGESTLWVLPNPSGLNAHYQLPDFARLFKQLLTRSP